MPTDALSSRRTAIVLGIATLPAACTTTPAGKAPVSLDEARAQVRQAELAFSAAMAARDLAAFAGFIADEAVFINGGKPLRGKPAILAVWQGYFNSPVAPFTWQPQIIEVAASGSLGYSEGPVTTADGNATLRYFSTWQLQAPGQWRVVFDNGYTVCHRAG